MSNSEDILKQIRDELIASNSKLDALTSLVNTQLLMDSNLDSVSEDQLFDRMIKLRSVNNRIKRETVNMGKAFDLCQFDHLQKQFDALAIKFFGESNTEALKRYQTNQLTFADLRDALPLHYNDTNAARIMAETVEPLIRKETSKVPSPLQSLNIPDSKALNAYLRRGKRQYRTLPMPHGVFICILTILSLDSPESGISDKLKPY